MKRKIGILMAMWLITSAFVHADTSYLLIQGAFGTSGSTESFKWQVNYASGTLVTGQDLLNAVFGTPVLTGTYSDGYGGSYPEYKATNGSNTAEYYYYAQLNGFFPISFTLGGTPLLQDPTYSPGWNYYVAGGSGPSLSGSNYANGSWTYSNDGISSRTIANGSYDAQVFGDTYPSAPIDDSTGADAPTAGEFLKTDSTDFVATVNAVPEPAVPLLLGAGIIALGCWKRKARA